MRKSEIKIIGAIPARFGSSRFKGKVLADIGGKPMIQWVYERTVKSTLLDDVFVVVDDPRVEECVQAFGGKVVMTGSHFQSGTDRIASMLGDIEADIVVNIQGDQPLIDPQMIDETVQPMLDNSDILMSTLKREIGKDDFDDTGVVKVVTDEQNYALYFSRSLIPFPRDSENLHVYEHVGLYAYRRDFLLTYSEWPQGYLEKLESLEQLRVLEKGYKIYVAETSCDASAGISVDVPADIDKVLKFLK
jgi:3-deoxy-manno-octulosonate cytidylyltransferase (CMP-KDO synthetase)